MNRIYQILRGTDDASVDAALAAAMPTADPVDLPRMAMLLIERGAGPASEALIACLHRLPADLQERVLHETKSLTPAIRRCAASENAQSCRNAASVIARSSAYSLAYLLSDQLRTGLDEVRPQAAEALLTLAADAGQTSGAPGPDQPTAQAVRQLVDAVELAIASYARHRQEAVLSAWALLLPRHRADAPAWQDADHPAAETMTRLITGSSPPEACRRALLAMLTAPSLRDGAGQALVGAAAAGMLHEALAMGHLVVVPAVARLVGALPEVDTLRSATGRLGGSSGPEGAGLAGWIDALAVEPDERAALLGRLARHGQAMTRLAAVRRLIRLPASESSSEALAGFCRDRQPAIGRMALRALVRRQWTGLPRLMPSLFASPDPAIRRNAGLLLGPIAFDRLWHGWPQLGPDHRLAAGRALIKAMADFHHRLAGRLAATDRRQRLRALSIIHELNQGALFESALVQLAGDPDHHVAASAVRALGSAEGSEARATLELALEHRDPRVRANAVEALDERRSTDHTQQLLTMTGQQEANRPRANAIAALMASRTDQALLALQRMLHDPRGSHRVSALWLVESAGVVDLARHVAEMAVSDPDAEVQRRAERVCMI